MEYPTRGMIVEVKRGDSDRWATALFYWNGKRPVFAQYGSEIKDVREWRKKQAKVRPHKTYFRKG